MEDLLYLSVLFEYYGKLLTERQFEICDMYLNQNLSFGEISEILAISRQGVRDGLLKSEKLLKEYENTLGIQKKNLILSELTDKIEKCLSDDSKSIEIRKILEQINELI